MREKTDPVSGIVPAVSRAVAVSTAGARHLERYGHLLAKWQKAKNLVAGGTLPNMAERHFLDSAQLVPLLDWQGDEPPVILDIGSGAGFPGLVIAMLVPCRMHLVESNAKKGAFMRQVCRETGLTAQVHTERVEDLSPFPVDFIISRACADLAQLLQWAAPFQAPHTRCLFLKGSRAQQELTEARRCWKVRVDQHASLTDPSGVILDLSDLSAV